MDELVCAFDVGGTKIAGICANRHGDVLSECNGVGRNLLTAGVSAVGEMILEQTQELCRKAGLSLGGRIHICAGVAGAGRPSDQRRLEEYLSSRRENCTAQVLPDFMVALEGAFHDRPGMLCISGTGSNVCIRDQNHVIHSAGGWGRQIGDPASATQLGMDAIRALIRNGINKPLLDNDSLLAKLVHEHHLDSRDNILAFVYGATSSGDDHSASKTTGPSDLAATVLEALEQGDPLATRIVTSGIHDFILQIKTCCGNLSQKPDKGLHYVHMGGLASHVSFAASFARQMNDALPNWEKVDALDSPEGGALRLALKFMASEWAPR